MGTILFILIVAIILTFFWRFPFLGLYLVIFTSPFLGLTIDFSLYTWAQNLSLLPSIQAPLSDILALMLLASIVLKSLVKISNRSVWSSKKIYWMMVFKETGLEYFIPFLVIGVFSLFNVENDQLAASFKYLLRPIIFFYLMWIVLPYLIISSKKILESCLKITLVTGIISACLGWFSIFLKDDFNLGQGLTPIGFKGLAPLTYNHNILAEVLVMAAPLIFYFFITWQKKGEKKTDQKKTQGEKENSMEIHNWTRQIEKIFFLIFVFIIITALLTFSRAAWLALLFELLAYLIFTNFKKNSRLVSPEGSPSNAFIPSPSLFHLLKTLGKIFILFSPLLVYLAFFSFSYTVQSSNATRLDMTEIALTYFKRHPLIGNGVGTFTTLIADTRLFTVEYGDPLDSHGLVQKLLAEEGLLGLLSFFIFAGWIIFSLYSSAKYSPASSQDLKKLILISFLGCLIFQLFNTSYYNQHLWLIAGLGLAAKKVYPPEII